MAGLQFDADSLLEALDGVAYLVNPTGVIIGVGSLHWNDFALNNDTPCLIADVVLGASLFSFIQGTDVRDLSRSIHKAVVSGRIDGVVLACRCDSPTMRRETRLSVSSIAVQERIIGALYQSQIVAELRRPPMDLFKPRPGAIKDRGRGAQEAIKLCSYCHDVTWPTILPAEEPEWVQPEVYYQRGGSSDVQIRHGICPDCFASIKKRLARTPGAEAGSWH